MELSPEIGSDDLEVFLQGAEEQLELLDEDLVRLEREEDTAPLLQEIFRVAHTIKGSSGMIGHRLMTDLAHSMENLLDQLRLGTTGISTGVVDALLGGLDLLRTMKDDLANSRDSQIDISEAVSVLDSLAETGETQALGQTSPQQSTALLHLDAEHEERVLLALDAGSRAYLVRANINPESSWVSIRCFQIVDALSQSSDIIISSPSLADIEAEKVSDLVQAVLSTDQDAQTLQQTVSAIEDIDDIEVTELDPQDTTSDIWQNLLSGSPDEAGDGASNGPDDIEGAHLGPSPGGQAEDGGEKELAAVGAPAKSEGNGPAGGTGDGGRQPAGGQQIQTVRVDVDRLDNLMNTIGELVIVPDSVQTCAQ